MKQILSNLKNFFHYLNLLKPDFKLFINGNTLKKNY